MAPNVSDSLQITDFKLWEMKSVQSSLYVGNGYFYTIHSRHVRWEEFWKNKSYYQNDNLMPQWARGYIYIKNVKHVFLLKIFPSFETIRITRTTIWINLAFYMQILFSYVSRCLFSSIYKYCVLDGQFRWTLNCYLASHTCLGELLSLHHITMFLFSEQRCLFV